MIVATELKRGQKFLWRDKLYEVLREDYDGDASYLTVNELCYGVERGKPIPSFLKPNEQRFNGYAEVEVVQLTIM